jgi:hypothetical protein
MNFEIHGLWVSLGGAEGIRTLDLLNAIQTRSQLRHSPKLEESSMNAFDMQVRWGLRAVRVMLPGHQICVVSVERLAFFGLSFEPTLWIERNI